MVKKNSKKAEDHADRSVKILADNLNKNVKLDHIDYVDHGVRPVDDNYHKFKKEFIELWGKEKYEKESLRREQKVEDLYGTEWKSKRISI